jgi:SnoaL-like domain
MTIQEIAARVVELNRANDHETIYRELYAPDAVSIENWAGKPERYEGLAAIGAKAEGWMQSVAEIHEVLVGEPIISDASFAMTFTMDITYKDPAVGRVQMTELAIYTVKDGKIVEEEFRA